MSGQSGGKASRSSRRKVQAAQFHSRVLLVQKKLKKAFVCCSPNGIAGKNKGLFRCAVALCLPDLQTCVLSSVELQVLTSSCFKLRTVHNIPVTSNKDGKKKRGEGGGKTPFIHLSLLFPSFHVFILPVFLLHTFQLPLSLFRVKSLTEKHLLTVWAQELEHGGGGCRRECSLQYVSHPVWSGRCHTVGRRSALGSFVFAFASDPQDARLAEPVGDIKAIWLTHSDLLPMASACAHTVRRHDRRADR